MEAETAGKTAVESKKEDLAASAKLEAEAREADQETLVASKKEMKEWMRGHRLHDYAADVTRIAGACVASLPSLSA